MERLTYTSLLGNRVSRGGCMDVECSTSCEDCGINKIISKLWEYEETGLTPEQVAAMKQELIDERYRHDRLQDFEVAEAQELAKVKAERDALLKYLRDHSSCDACKHETRDCNDEPCNDCRGTGGIQDNWEWFGAKDTNVPSKEED